MQTPRLPRIWIFLALLTAGICQMSLAQAPASTPSPIAALRPIAQANRVAGNANLGPQTQLTGHIPDWVTAANQVASQPVDLTATMHLTVVLRRDPAAQAAFTQFLADQQNPSSPLYHQWLTPQQVGQLFGLTDSDIAAVSNWLTAQGLTVSVEPNRTMLRVSGTAESIAAAFRISFAYFNVGDKPHLSTTVEPFIPTALTPVVNSIGGLTEIPLHPYSHAVTGKPSATAAPTIAHPDFTLTNGGVTQYFLTPKDFAVIYDINSVYTAGNTGATIGTTPQHVAIMGESRVAATDISEYATNVALGGYKLVTMVPPTSYGGVDPGTTNDGAQDEATIDVDRVIGTAPGVIADLLVSSASSGGIGIGLEYNINALLDPIQTVSFGACESQAGKASTQEVDQLFQQAAAEGITTFISSDDSGADGCAASFTPVTQAYAASINYLCSSSYVTCVGGTEFNDTANPSLYWAAGNGTGMESALSYIPEGAWNEPTGNCNTGTYCPSASGGGASLYIAKPSWQNVAGVPSDKARDVPDVAFSSASHDGYYACLDYALVGAKGIPAGANCTPAGQGYFSVFSGTSTAAPGMAGITALLNTKTGSTHGNLNPLLYSVYVKAPAAFHDVTVASSGVSGCTVSTPSMCNNSTPGASTLTGGLAGFLVTAGYDEVTGLGSLDVGQFLTASVSVVTPVATSLSATALPNPAVINQTVTLTATLTPGTSTSTPTGTVQFYSNGTAIGSPATLTANIASTTYSFATAGTYAITAIYSGDTNFTTSTASAVSLVINTPNFTVTPTTASYNLISGATTGNADTITVTSTGSFAGLVNLTCVATSASGTAGGTCTLTPPAVALTAGSSANSALLITTTPGTSGVLDIRITGTSGSSVVTSSVIAVNLTAPSFTLTPSPSTLSFTSGATSGNTDTITVSSVNGFTGQVAFNTCSISSSSAYYQPTCTISPSTVTVPASGTMPTAVVTVNSTVQTSALDRSFPLKTTFLALLFFIPALRRRRKFLALMLLFCGISAISGCSSSSTPPPPVIKSSAGTYTVTISATGTTTGSSIATTANTNFSLTIN